jgi:hypothetical protein
VPGDEYFANDHLCDCCAREEDQQQDTDAP